MLFGRIKELFCEELSAVAVMMVVAYFFMILGILALLSATYQEYRGVTREPALSGSGMRSFIHTAGRVTRDANPDAFRGAMQFHWLYAVLMLFAGFILRSIVAAQDRCDPLAPDSDREKDD